MVSDFKSINAELWEQLGMKVPFEALERIRQIRHGRGGRQGNTEVKRECKILLAIRDNRNWQLAESKDIEYIIPMHLGGKETASNVRLAK